MTVKRIAGALAALALAAGVVNVAAPAAQAQTGEPVNVAACHDQLGDGYTRLALASYDIGHLRAEGRDYVVSSVGDAGEALDSPLCAGLESYIGADRSVAQAAIVTGLDLVDQAQWVEAGEVFDQAADAAFNAIRALYPLIYPDMFPPVDSGR